MPDFATAQDRHNYIMAHVEYFTTVLFRGRGVYDRVEYPTLEAAEKGAEEIIKDFPHKRVLIYAVAGLSDTLVKTVP